MYADFDNSNPESVENLALELQSQVRQHNHTPASTRSANDSTTSGTSRDTHLNGLSNRVTPSIRSELPSMTSTTTDSDNSCYPRFDAGQKPAFLELCINTGEFSVSLGELDVREITSDGALFQKIWAKYREIRGFRMRMVYLKPCEIQFVYVSYAILLE